MNTTIRNYESLYIVDATLTDEQVDSIIAKYSKVIADQGGEVQAAGSWDKRRLAYEVKGRREGLYILTYFTGEPSVAKELDRVMRISDEVMRHIILRVEPQHVDTTRIEKPPVASAEAAAEVAAEAAPAEETPAEAEASVEAPAEAPAEAPTEEPAVEAAAEEAPEEAPAAEETAEEAASEEPKAEE